MSFFNSLIEEVGIPRTIACAESLRYNGAYK
jgi:hypothetical protein